MIFELTEEQALIQKMVREMTDMVIEPLGKQIDAENDIPKEVFDVLKDLELFGLPYPEELGGSGAGYTAYPPVLEQIAKASSGVALMLSVHFLGLSAIDKFGTQEQKQKYIIPACQGESVLSFAFTEPGTGSDPKQIMTEAKKEGDTYILNGVKRFISNADIKGPIVIFANEAESNQTTAFLVDKLCEGYSLSEPWHKIGLRGSRAYDVFLSDVKIPAKNVLGEPGKGYAILQHGIACGKVGMSSLFLGVMQASLDEAVEYALGKPHRDKTISKFQAIRLKIADMAAKIEAARWLVYRLGYLLEHMTDMEAFNRESALTKLFVTDTAMDVVRTAVAVHGSYGVMDEFKVERLYRDVVIGEQIEGANDLQRLMVSNSLL